MTRTGCVVPGGCIRARRRRPMGDAPTVRDELARDLGARFGAIDRRPLPPETGTFASCTRDVADAVLTWLGQLDPDCDPALLAHHLHTSRDHIAQLRQ